MGSQGLQCRLDCVGSLITGHCPMKAWLTGSAVLTKRCSLAWDVPVCYSDNSETLLLVSWFLSPVSPVLGSGPSCVPLGSQVTVLRSLCSCRSSVTQENSVSLFWSDPSCSWDKHLFLWQLRISGLVREDPSPHLPARALPSPWAIIQSHTPCLSYILKLNKVWASSFTKLPGVPFTIGYLGFLSLSLMGRDASLRQGSIGASVQSILPSSCDLTSVSHCLFQVYKPSSLMFPFTLQAV